MGWAGVETMRYGFLAAAFAISALFLGPAVASIDAVSDLCNEIEALDDPVTRTILMDDSGQASKRVALVIGNGAYNSVQPLNNPRNDAIALSGKLRQLGFFVYLIVDGRATSIVDCIDKLLAVHQQIDVGLLFYAGHGIQISDDNYILGVEAAVNDPAAEGLLPIAQLVQRIQDQSAATILMLDACRNNPFDDAAPAGLSSSTLRAVKLRIPGAAEGTQPAGTRGLFVAYATSPGSAAADGSGENSPFTTALLNNILEPGLSLHQLMTKVTDAVDQATEGEQRPWARSSQTFDLKLVGQLTEMEAVTASNLWASRSREFLAKGRKREAISAALKGLPAQLIASDYVRFSDTMNALTDAVKSGSVWINTTSSEGIANLSPDSSRVGLARPGAEPNSRSIELWSGTTGEKIAQLALDARGDDTSYDGSSVLGPVFSGDSRRIASVVNRKNISIWDATNGNLVRKIENVIRGTRDTPVDPLTIQYFSLNQDGSLVAVTGGDVALVTVWNVDSGAIVFQLDFSVLSSTFRDIDFSPYFSKFTNEGSVFYPRCYFSGGLLIFSGSFHELGRQMILRIDPIARTVVSQLSIKRTGAIFSSTVSPDARYVMVHFVDDHNGSDHFIVADMLYSREIFSVSSKILEIIGFDNDSSMFSLRSGANNLIFQIGENGRFVEREGDRLAQFEPLAKVYTRDGSEFEGYFVGEPMTIVQLWNHAPIGPALLDTADTYLEEDERQQLQLERLRFIDPR